MRWILHRGNMNGPGTCENKPSGIDIALQMGYDVEVDLWFKDNEYWLGHDMPEHRIESDFLQKPGLWIHCKNAETLEHMSSIYPKLHFFYHTTEDYILTSRGIIWSYVGKPPLRNSVIVMPERVPGVYNYRIINDFNCLVCSDYLPNDLRKYLS